MSAVIFRGVRRRSTQMGTSGDANVGNSLTELFQLRLHRVQEHVQVDMLSRARSTCNHDLKETERPYSQREIITVTMIGQP